VPLQPGPVLGCRTEGLEGDAAAWTEQSGWRRVDRHLASSLRASRHAGAVHGRQDGVARLRASDQLGRDETRGPRAARNESGVQRMRAPLLPRPRLARAPFRHLFAAGMVGFVLGAFVVASLGHMSATTGKTPLASIVTPIGGLDGAVDEPTNAVVE